METAEVRQVSRMVSTASQLAAQVLPCFHRVSQYRQKHLEAQTYDPVALSEDFALSAKARVHVLKRQLEIVVSLHAGMDPLQTTRAYERVV